MQSIAFIGLLEGRDIRGNRQGFTVQVELHAALAQIGQSVFVAVRP